MSSRHRDGVTYKAKKKRNVPVDCIYLVHAYEMIHCPCQFACLFLHTFIQRHRSIQIDKKPDMCIHAQGSMVNAYSVFKKILK